MNKLVLKLQCFSILNTHDVSFAAAMSFFVFLLHHLTCLFRTPTYEKRFSILLKEVAKHPNDAIEIEFSSVDGHWAKKLKC